jgi:hypothetical protein
MSNKHDVEMAKFALEMRKSAHLCTNLKTIGMYGTFTFLIYTCGHGVRDIIKGSPESLEWLYKILCETKISTYIHSAVTILLGGTAALQFARNRRLTKKAGATRHQLEYTDESNERSGLASDGTAREDRET